MLRDFESAVTSTCAICLYPVLLFHQVVEAGLAVELVSTLCHKQRNGAAKTALVIDELITVDGTVSLAVTKLLFSALLAQEVLRIHVLSCCSFKIINATQKHNCAMVAIVKSGLIKHELGWLGIVHVTLGSDSTSLVQILFLENVNGYILGYLAFLLSYADEISQFYWCGIELDLLFANWAIEVIEVDSFGFPTIFESAIDAVSVIGMPAFQANAWQS